jgi:hypothetical protein
MMNTIDKVIIMNKARLKYRAEHEVEVKEQAKEFFEKYKNDSLFTAGIMLYWAEGKKSQKDTCTLELNNSDPALLKLYYQFLCKYLKVKTEMIRIRLFLYPDIDENKVKLFWSELLNIPLNQFIKSYVSVSRSFVTRNKLKYGTCSLYVPSKDLRLIMAVWIGQFISLYS